MQNSLQRQYKIELTISRRKRQILTESLTNVQPDSDQCVIRKSKSHRRMIDLTLCTRAADKKHRESNSDMFLSQNSKMVVSQFLIDSQKHGRASNPDKQPIPASIHQIQINEDQDKLWQYLKCGEDSKSELVRELLKKQRKNEYFVQLLRHNRQKYQTQKRERIRRYESYICKMKEMYEEQLQQAQRLDIIVKELEEKHDEDFYREIRLKINKDGRKGLNFSPKRVSLLSGIAETLLLSDKSSGSEQRRRTSNQFSFGSSLQKMTNDQSLLKQAMFLEGDFKKRKLNFSNT